jgi:uncharacterized protein YggU (UPF0235/DUF167 family)
MAGRTLITIRVHPGASRTKVAAEAREAREANQVLGVWVHERAVGGQATEAALAAVADALGVRRTSVRLVTGARARLKVIEVADPPADLPQRLGRIVSPARSWSSARLSGTGPGRRRRRS